MNNSMLSLKNINAGYGKLQILHDLNLDVEHGDLLAVIGPNGCGKSTMLKTIFGMLNINSGDVLLKGKSIGGNFAHELVKFGIGYVPQGRMVVPTMSVKENLEMGAFTLNDKGLIRKRMKEVSPAQSADYDLLKGHYFLDEVLIEKYQTERRLLLPAFG